MNSLKNTALKLLAKAGMLLLLGSTAAAIVKLAKRYQRFEVVGDSMEPTLSAGDRLLIRRGAVPAEGSLIVFPDPRDQDRLLVKRAQRVSAGEVVAVGDNPIASTDSRHFGLVAVSDLIGVALLKYSPSASVRRL